MIKTKKWKKGPRLVSCRTRMSLAGRTIEDLGVKQGMLARLLVFHDPPFSSYGRKKEAFKSSDSLGLLNLLHELKILSPVTPLEI